MDAKEYLSRAYNLDKLIDAALVELSDVRKHCDFVRSIDYSKDKVQSMHVNAIENTVVKLIDMENAINEKIDQLVDLKTDIRCKIDELPDDTERVLLTYRYLCFLNWEEIAEKMNYSYRGVYYLHKKALASFESLHSFAQ